MVVALPTPNKSPLFVGDLPFETVAFHAFDKDQRQCFCRVFEVEGIKKENVADLMAQLAGMETLKAQLTDLSEQIHVDMFRHAIRVAMGRDTGSKFPRSMPARRNLVFKGPTGTGKTTAAQAAAIYMIVSKLVTGNKIFFIKGADLLGDYTGQTKSIVNALMERAAGCVLIVDEVDAISTARSSTSFDANARDALNGNIENFNKDGGAVIFTGYPKDMDALFRDQPGFVERFPIVISFGDFDDKQIELVLKKKIAMEGLSFAPDALEAAMKQLSRARAIRGERFGNARAIERFVDKLTKHHAMQFSSEDFQKVYRQEKPPENMQIVDVCSIPFFDDQAQDFSSHPSSRGNLRLIADQPKHG